MNFEFIRNVVTILALINGILSFVGKIKNYGIFKIIRILTFAFVPVVFLQSIILHIYHHYVTHLNYLIWINAVIFIISFTLYLLKNENISKIKIEQLDNVDDGKIKHILLFSFWFFATCVLAFIRFNSGNANMDFNVFFRNELIHHQLNFELYYFLFVENLTATLLGIFRFFHLALMYLFLIRVFLLVIGQTEKLKFHCTFYSACFCSLIAIGVLNWIVLWLIGLF